MVKKHDPFADAFDDRPSVVVSLQQPTAPAAPAPKPQPEPRAKAIEALASITMHQTPEVRKLMRQISYETEISKEDLYAIALNLLFRGLGKPLAAIYRDPAAEQMVVRLTKLATPASEASTG